MAPVIWIKKNLIFSLLIIGFVTCFKMISASTEENTKTVPLTEAEKAPSSSTSSKVITQSSDLEGYEADFENASASLNHRITRVTVFSDRATVVREAKTTLKSGMNWIAFSDLPAEFDKKSLRLKASDGFQGRIAQIVIQDSFEKVSLPNSIQAQLTELRQHYGVLVDQQHQKNSLATQFHFIQNLKLDAPFQRMPTSTSYKSFTATPQILKTAMDEINEQSVIYNNRVLSIQEKIDKTQQKISLLENQLRHITNLSDQKKRSVVFVLVKSEKPTDAQLELSYMIQNASWRPVYDVRADLSNKDASASIELVTAAMVEQHTGEDWSNVQLTVSTLDPVPLYLPHLKRWSFSEKRIEAPVSVKGRRQNTLGYSVGSASSPPPPPPPKSGSKPGLLGHFAKNSDSIDNYREVAAKEAESAPPQASGGYGLSADAMEESLVAEDKAEAVSKKTMARGNMLAEKIGKDKRPNKSYSTTPSVPTTYELDSLEAMFPVLSELKQNVNHVRSNAAEFQPFEITERPQAPVQNTYSDSTLPAMMAGGRNIEMTSPFNVSIKSDEAPQKIPLNSQQLKASLYYFAVPKKSSKVFLRASTNNTSQYPLLGGPAQIFMNGDLVSKTSLPSVSEGGGFKLDLGNDSNVEVKRIVDRKSDNSGIFKKSHHDEFKIKIEVANHHSFPVKVELKDNYPLSPNDDIVVEMKSRKPSSIKQPNGLLAWQLDLPPRTKQAVNFDYSITYPENFIISEENQ